MSQIFNFFPLSVLKSKINLTRDQKQKMIDEVFSMEKKSKNLGDQVYVEEKEKEKGWFSIKYPFISAYR